MKLCVSLYNWLILQEIPNMALSESGGEDRDKEKALSREGRRKKALSPYQQPGGGGKTFWGWMGSCLSRREGGSRMCRTQSKVNSNSNQGRFHPGKGDQTEKLGAKQWGEGFI